MKIRSVVYAMALVAGAGSLGAQQPAAPAGQPDSSATPAAPVPAPSTGPRVRHDLQPAVLAVAVAPAARRATHTFTLSTVALVLVVVLVVLLVT